MSPAEEPNKLLAAFKCIDNTCDSVRSVAATGAKLGDLLSDTGVRNSSRVMVNSFGRNTSVSEKNVSLVHTRLQKESPHVLRLAEGKSEVSVRLMSCWSAPSEQHPSPAVEAPRKAMLVTNFKHDRNCCRRTELRTGIFIDANNAHLEVDLVLVDLLPHLGGNGTPPAVLVLVGDGIDDDDTSIVALTGRNVESRQLETLLRNENLLKRNAVALESPAG